MNDVEYVSVPISTDPAELTQDVFDYITALVSGWSTSDGNMDVRIISALVRVAAESRDVASDVPTTIFRYFGNSLVNLPPLDGAAATLSLTFTAGDTLGHTIPAGTLVQGTDGSGNQSYWSTVFDAVIPPASSSIAGVAATSSVTGTAYNTLSFSAGQLTMVANALSYITAVAAVGASSGGVDAEDDPTYLNRLRGELQLLSPAPIIASDFSTLARNFAGVDRSITLDGYDQPSNTFSVARTVTVYVMEPDGSTPPSPTLTGVQAYLASLREANFVIYVVGPYSNSFNVATTVVAGVGVDHTALSAAITAAVDAFLSPANWGVPKTGDGTQWINQQWVRLSALQATVQDVDGVDHVTALTIAGSAADYDLTGGGANGPVCVPHVNTLTVTVT